jgi:hypothetical protein
MHPFEVGPGWYESYWYAERGRRKRSSVGGSVARFAVAVVLLAGGGMALSHFHVPGHAGAAHDGAHDWEQE